MSFLLTSCVNKNRIEVLRNVIFQYVWSRTTNITINSETQGSDHNCFLLAGFVVKTRSSLVQLYHWCHQWIIFTVYTRVMEIARNTTAAAISAS